MKTTIDIPDALYRRVKIQAFEQGTTVRDLLLRSLHHAVGDASPADARPKLAKEESKLYEINDLGFAVLKRPPGGAPVLTNDWVNRIREEEGF